MNTETDRRAWYKEPLVWLIIFFPSSAVLGGIITTWLAVASDDGLVIDDYYKYGLQINKVLDREQAAERYGLKAVIIPNQESRRLRLRLYANQHFSMPDAVRLQFLHPTRDGFDQALILPRTGRDVYEGELPELIRGNWYLHISAGDWRVLEYFPVL